MDIKQLKEEAEANQRKIVGQINLLDQRKQELLQEALRLDGEIRGYDKMLEQSKKEDKKK